MTHSTITSKGQTTLPVHIRKALHLKTGDKILYELQGDSVMIRPHLGALTLFGSLKPSAGKALVPFKQARTKARESWVAAATREGLP